MVVMVAMVSLGDHDDLLDENHFDPGDESHEALDDRDPWPNDDDLQQQQFIQAAASGIDMDSSVVLTSQSQILLSNAQASQAGTITISNHSDNGVKV